MLVIIILYCCYILVLNIGNIRLLTIYTGKLELLVELFNAMNCNKFCESCNAKQMYNTA